MRYLLLALLFVLSACATLPERIHQDVRRNDFAAALQRLEEKGVGIVVVPNADGEALAARQVYEDGVYIYYKKKIEDELSSGNLVKAHRISLEGKSHCPWSQRLDKMQEELRSRVDELDGLQLKWASVSSQTLLSFDKAHAIIADMRPVFDVMNDSPRLKALFGAATQCILHEWASRLNRTGNNVTHSFVDEFSLELAGLPNIPDYKNRLVEALHDYVDLPKKTPRKASKTFPFSANHQTSLSNVIDFFQFKSGRGFLNEHFEIIQRLFSLWCVQNVSNLLRDPRVTFKFVEIGERLLSSNILTEQKDLVRSLAKAHLTRAKTFSAKGKSAALTILHVMRMKEFDYDLYNRNALQLLKTAQKSITESKPIPLGILIQCMEDSNTGLPASLKRLLSLRISEATTSQFKWIWNTSPFSKKDVDIVFTRVKMHTPSDESLRIVKSKFLSHYEDRGNPVRKELVEKMQRASLDIDQSRNAYDYAKRKYDADPTLDNLQGRDSAFDRYNRSLEHYDSLRRKYETSSATKTVPIYTPYTFKEGKVYSGWDIAAEIKTHGGIEYFNETNIVSDFVRLGSNPKDINKKYRNEDPISINSSTAKLIERLEVVLRGLIVKLKSVPIELPATTFPDVDNSEKRILTDFYQPFGMRLRKGHPQWIVRAIEAWQMQSSRHKRSVPLFN